MRTLRGWLPPGGVAICLTVSLVPPIRHALEASMTAQMLAQLPLLIAAGWMLSPAVSPRVRAGLHGWNRGGVTGLLLATFVAAFWMLPRSLDASTTDPVMGAAKVLSVPLLIGLPLALSWPRAGFVVRGIVLVEIVATCFRLGWLYRVSPARLCNSYGLDDQQRLGGYLLVLGSGLLVWVTWKLLLGRVDRTVTAPGTTDDQGWVDAELSPEAASAYEDARLRGLCHAGAMEVAGHR